MVGLHVLDQGRYSETEMRLVLVAVRRQGTIPDIIGSSLFLNIFKCSTNHINNLKRMGGLENVHQTLKTQLNA